MNLMLGFEENTRIGVFWSPPNLNAEVRMMRCRILFLGELMTEKRYCCQTRRDRRCGLLGHMSGCCRIACKRPAPGTCATAVCGSQQLGNARYPPRFITSPSDIHPATPNRPRWKSSPCRSTEVNTGFPQLQKLNVNALGLDGLEDA